MRAVCRPFVCVFCLPIDSNEERFQSIATFGMTQDIDDDHMEEDIKLEDSFCGKYLGNKRLFPHIKEETIKTMFDNGFDCFPTLMAMDFEEDLPLIGVSIGQKALLRRAITLLHDDYDKHISHMRLMVTGEDLDQLFARIEKAISGQPIDNHSQDMSQTTFDLTEDPNENDFCHDFTRLKNKSCDLRDDEEMPAENDTNVQSDHDLRQEIDSDSQSNIGPNEIDYLSVEEPNEKSDFEAMTEEEYDDLKKTALISRLSVIIEKLEIQSDQQI